MKTTAFFFFALNASTRALLMPVSPAVRHPSTIASSRILEDANDDDFDAPADRASAVGNLVQAKKPSLFGVELPLFLAKAFGVRFGETGAAVHDDNMVLMMDMDEECYLGKNGDLEECADFDPPVKP